MSPDSAESAPRVVREGRWEGRQQAGGEGGAGWRDACSRETDEEARDCIETAPNGARTTSHVTSDTSPAASGAHTMGSKLSSAYAAFATAGRAAHQRRLIV